MSGSTRNFINIDASTGTLHILQNQDADANAKPDLISIIEGNNIKEEKSLDSSSKTLQIMDSNN
jgi:hypothetical protein